MKRVKNKKNYVDYQVGSDLLGFPVIIRHYL